MIHNSNGGQHLTRHPTRPQTGLSATYPISLIIYSSPVHQTQGDRKQNGHFLIYYLILSYLFITYCIPNRLFEKRKTPPAIATVLSDNMTA